MRRAALLLGLLTLALPSVAGAAPILLPGDAAELAQTLADAEAAQSICYGWEIDVTAADGTTSTEQGSSRGGPGVVLDRSVCPRWAQLRGEIRYTSEDSETEDLAAVAIATSDDLRVPAGGFTRLGLSAGSLTSENDDVALTNLVESLPLLVAESGAAPPVGFQPRTDALPATDRPTDRPGSDWLRKYATVVVGIVVLLAIVVVIGFRYISNRAKRAGEQS